MFLQYRQYPAAPEPAAIAAQNNNIREAKAVEKAVSELVGFESGSRIHQKLLDLRAKISVGKEALSGDEIWQYEYLSRLGQSFRE